MKKLSNILLLATMLLSNSAIANYSTAGVRLPDLLFCYLSFDCKESETQMSNCTLSKGFEKNFQRNSDGSILYRDVIPLGGRYSPGSSLTKTYQMTEDRVDISGTEDYSYNFIDKYLEPRRITFRTITGAYVLYENGIWQRYLCPRKYISAVKI